MNKTLKLCLPAAVLAAFSTTVFAQEPKNPLIGGQKAIYGIVSDAVVRGAEKMPEDDYSFKPTPEVRSFGQLVGHVADAQYAFCSMALGEKSPAPHIEKTKTSKADLVAALKEAVAYCDKAYNGMTDAQASEIIKFFGRDSARLTALAFNNAHTDEHYGNMVTYLRIKDIVPPTSEKKK